MTIVKRTGRRARAIPAGVFAALLPACAQLQSSSDIDAPVTEEVAVVQQAIELAGISSVADTTVKSASPALNFGGLATLSVSGPTGALESSIVRFDQAQINSAVGTNKVYSAKIVLTAAAIPNGWNGGRIGAHRMLRSWTEGNGSVASGQGATWACAVDTNNGNTTNDCTGANTWNMTANPLAYNGTATGWAELYASTTAKTVVLDVTSDVQAFLAGTPNYGILLKGTTGGSAGAPVVFDARQATNAPKLVLDVGPDLCTADNNKVTPGQCGCGVADMDTDGDKIADCLEPTLLPSGDTVVRGNEGNKNGGHEAQLKVTRASVFGFEYSLIQFSQAQIAAAVPAGKKVFGAQLEFTVDGDSGSWAGGEINLHRMTMPWTEGNGADPIAGGSGATWLCARDTNTTNANKDCASADVWGVGSFFDGPVPFVTPASAKAFVYSGSTKKLVFDVTADVKAFVAGTSANNGWLLRGKDDAFAADWLNVGSRESANPPKLVLTVSDDCSVLKPAYNVGSHLRDLECFSSSIPACTRRVVAKVNSDVQQSAKLYMSKQVNPAQDLALARDRQRKSYLLRDNALLASAFCDGDDDGDLIGNANDACKSTLPLVATDDSGCEVTTLPVAPPRSFIDSMLASAGVTYDARCVGAARPIIPNLEQRSQVLLARAPASGTNPEVLLQFTHFKNQPAGCEWQYEVEVTLDRTTGGSVFLTSVFPSVHEQAFLGSTNKRWIAVPMGASPWPLTQLFFKRSRGGDEALWWSGNFSQARFRIRAVNALGMASDWSAVQTATHSSLSQ